MDERFLKKLDNEDKDKLERERIINAQARFDILRTKHAQGILILMSDWKEETEHAKEVTAVTAMRKSWGGVYHFPAWYNFETASGDDIITLFTQKPMQYDMAEELVDLWYNQGAVYKEPKRMEGDNQNG